MPKKKKDTTPKNNITDLIFIIDRSGSMHGLEADTIGGFNSMIEKQKKEEGKVFVTTTLFSNSSEIIYDRVSLEEIKEMTEKDYTAYGCTALLDAVGETILRVEKEYKDILKEEVPEKVICVIITDGMENASKEFSSTKIKEMIEERKKKNWDFLFFGANINVVETAKSYGISEKKAVKYESNSEGTRDAYCCIAEEVCKMRKEEDDD